ncbi:hypothetical protein T4D_14688 [Trichinella pseudospiralis]|uniref:Uncharacterized protein n=1 Tax=Trichinella pseudospiralis TaxID=6337 RepID=A0A0V1FI29_TRIPS|nr:hypothetical protein T4D_14688 [Trichinella pseudospiralis]
MSSKIEQLYLTFYLHIKKFPSFLVTFKYVIEKHYENHFSIQYNILRTIVEEKTQSTSAIPVL